MDWRQLQRLGLHELRLAPEVFWALTPYELFVMLGKTSQSTPMLSAHLAQLVALYPDQGKPDERLSTDEAGS